MNKLEYLKQYREANGDRVRALSRTWYSKNTDYRKEYMKAWRKLNKEKLRISREKYTQKTRARNFIFKSILKGLLEKATNRPCFKCGKQAKCYHHINYDIDKTFANILPVCVGCHNIIHKRKNSGTKTRN